MRRLISKTFGIIGFLIFFSLFHFFIGESLANELVSRYSGVTSTEINRLSILEDNSIYINNPSTYSLLRRDVLGTIESDSVSVTTTDPRILAMRQFLIDHYSPLYRYAEVFVVEADRYGLDWRLVASISGVESAFGNLIPQRSNNGWGWRGGPGGNWSMFPTWSDGIEHVTRRLALGYGTNLTPFQIEPVYCPPCAQNPQHAWANGVTQFMNELTYYLDNLDSIY